MPLSKPQKRALRDLAATAWERELSAELTTLEAAFARWRAGEIDAHDLSDLVHRFDQGPARKLYSHYSGSHPEIPVTGAIARGVLAESEVPADLLALWRPMLASLRA